MRIRELDAGRDLPLVLELLARLESATGVAPLGESKFVDLTGPGIGRGFVVERPGTDAYLHLLFHATSSVWEMEVAAPPDIDDESMAGLIETAVEAAGAPVLWWTFGDSSTSTYALREFAVVRELHKRSGSIPPDDTVGLPDGLSVRPFRPGVDEDRWLTVNNAAFAGHAENGAWSRADLEARMELPWFDPAGFRLAWMGEELAGFCWTKRHPDEVGEIYVIGVHPGHQGRGIGRAIVIEGLWYLAAAGCSTGMLYVDTANRSALALYQSLGLTLERVDRCVVVPKGWPHDAQ